MERTITINGRTGRFDIPSFILSENEPLKIFIVFEKAYRIKRYKLTIRHGDLMKTFTLYEDNSPVELSVEWLNKNAEDLEFSLALLDENQEKVIKDDFEIEPLKIETVGGNFQFSAMVQSLMAWQQEHGEKLNALEQRFDEYEANGVNLSLEEN